MIPFLDENLSFLLGNLTIRLKFYVFKKQFFVEN